MSPPVPAPESEIRRRFHDLRVEREVFGVAVEPGTARDYDALARFHYRPGRPATIARVLVARLAEPNRPPADRLSERTGLLIGVLVVSMPTLNARWRSRAWPGLCDPGTGKAEAACRLNAEVRTISRVVVDPRFRGLGIGRTLVAAYLDRPLTPATEAVAAMGACCPFFKAAGMTEHELRPTERDERLLRTLRELGLKPWRLVDSRELTGSLTGPRRAAFDAALRRWANASRATRRLVPAPLEELIRAAARAVADRRFAYTHDARPPRVP